MKPNFYCSSDYAGLTCKNADFYYGYEHSICGECGESNSNDGGDDHLDAARQWCFTAKLRGQPDMIAIPFNKLQGKDMFNVVQNLNIGIGWILTKYDLRESLQERPVGM